IAVILLDPINPTCIHVTLLTTIFQNIKPYFAFGVILTNPLILQNQMLSVKVFFSFRLSLQGSPQRIICLHLTLSSASSSLTPTNFMSSFTTSINLLFGLPLGLLPGSSNLSIL
ncbi:hypothetical protein LDENG_00223950, partial [Lucifuga dentata]